MDSARDFHHPFQPYDIQIQFMSAVYNCIEQRKVGILESPTGTGKSLSLICSALTWLREHQEDELKREIATQNNDEPQWVLEHEKQEMKNAFINKKQALEQRLAKVRAKELRQKQRYESGESHHKRSKLGPGLSQRTSEEDESQFLLADYDSDIGESKGPGDHAPNSEGLSTTSLEMLIKLGLASKPSNEDDQVELDDACKIFYCSRTHSQLTQFANEVRRVKIPSKLMSHENEEIGNKDEELMIEEIKHLSLGSRKNLCINPRVLKLTHPIAINERCLDLQQSKTSEAAKCSFLPTKENEPLVHSFRDHALARIRDIEELGSLGKKIGICPYYASRAVISPSEVVTLPYPLMLQKTAREALGISLKDHVVIIDEAHNLMDAISGIYSVTVSLAQLKTARIQVGIYLQKFKNRLKGKNRVYVTQVVRLLDSLITYLESKVAQGQKKDGIVQVVDLTAGKGADQINLYKLSKYLQESKLARKIDGYTARMDEQEPGQRKDRTTSPMLTQVQSFFQALTNPAAEGRFFLSTAEDGDICLRYMLLDPQHHFREIVEEARSVILAGGTMSPMEDYKQHLFPYLDPSRLRTLSCGHVIPDDHMIAWPITKGPNGLDFDFTYESRNLPRTIDELGECLLTLSKIVPDGLVVFFPSYAYLEQVISKWTAKKPGIGCIWDKLQAQKHIFRESKQTASVDDIFQQYSNAITNNKGALLMSVVGGKMSEGINFSDRLGRGVVVVGLPFPNIQSSEWIAKLEYIEQSIVSRGGSIAEGKNAARSFYENACMRSVNQSIGRAIRHKGDYASIIMLDRRYNTPRIQDKLPGWIKNGLVKDAGRKPFAEAVGSIEDFFARKKDS